MKKLTSPTKAQAKKPATAAKKAAKPTKVAAKSAPKATVKAAPKAVAAAKPIPRYVAPVKAVQPVALVALRPAGGWLRVLASMLDGIILGILSLVVGLVVSVTVHFMVMPDENTPSFISVLMSLISYMIGAVVGLIYQGYFVSRYRATPGKMLLRLEVGYSSNLTTLSFWPAVGRAWASSINIFTLYLSYLMVFWRRDKRGLHDLMANTQVVRLPGALAAWRWIVAIVLTILFYGFIVFAVVALLVIGAQFAAREALLEGMTQQIQPLESLAAPLE